MTASVTDDRQAFEAWAVSEWGYNLRRSSVNSDDYHYLSTQRSWQGWQAALRSQGKVVSEEDVAKMQALAESWRVNYYDHLGEPAYLKCAEDLTAIIGEGD